MGGRFARNDGGALYGNAGCYGGDIATSLERAWVLVRGETQEWTVDRFAFGYRTSVLKQMRAAGIRWQDQPIVLAAAFRLHRDDLTALAQRMERTSNERRSKTPGARVAAVCSKILRVTVQGV
jgi:UDP-N-acetylmuramate dehydrogenase (EC 1.1.1.158)